MLFFTLVLITLYLILLVRGSIFTNTIIKVGELTLKANEQGLKNYGEKKLNEELGKLVMPMMFYTLSLLLVEMIYLINALRVDYLKYPTIIIMVLIMMAFVTSSRKSKKDDLATEEGRQSFKKKLYKNSGRTFKGTIYKLIYLSYFIYMFYVLVLR